MTLNPVQTRRKKPPAIKLGDRTRVVRREMGLTQAEFAAELANYLPTVKDRAYGAWEAGINEPENKAEVCVALEAMTGYPREWFMGWGEPAEAPDGPGGGGGASGDPRLSPLTDSNRRPPLYIVGGSAFDDMEWPAEEPKRKAA